MPPDDPPKKRKNRHSYKYERLTPEFVFACGKLFCTQEEIGDLCGISQSHISERLNSDPELVKAYRTGRAQGKVSLRRAQAKKAIQDGHLVAQIWLGKQVLGQSDKTETHDTHDVNVNVQYIARWGASPSEITAGASPSLPAPRDDSDPPDPPDPPDNTPHSLHSPHSQLHGQKRTKMASLSDDDIIDGEIVEDPHPF